MEIWTGWEVTEIQDIILELNSEGRRRLCVRACACVLARTTICLWLYGLIIIVNYFLAFNNYIKVHNQPKNLGCIMQMPLRINNINQLLFIRCRCRRSQWTVILPGILSVKFPPPIVGVLIVLRVHTLKVKQIVSTQRTEIL